MLGKASPTNEDMISGDVRRNDWTFAPTRTPVSPKTTTEDIVLWLRLSVSGVSSDVHEAFQTEAEARPRHLPVDPGGLETEVLRPS